MTSSRAEPAGGPAESTTLHIAARIEDWIHERRARRARRRGRVATVIPFTGYGGDGWVRILGRVVYEDPERASDPSRRVRGWRSFTSVHAAYAEVTVTSGTDWEALRADRGGVLDAHVKLALPAGWNTVRLRVDGGQAVEAPIFVVSGQHRFGILSDIDDTVMVTALPRPFLAAWNTFVLDEHARRPVPGMAVLYERLAQRHPGCPVFYLSTGAWNVAPTLSRFLHRNLYPRGPLLLTDWGPTHDRWFRSGQQHKRESLTRLAHEFPDIRWLLVGDDGQHDEDLYAAFAAEYPQNVAAIAIRQLTAGEAVLAGGRSRRPDQETASTPWVFAPDGAGLSTQLRTLGMLDPRA
ncbi:MAG: ACP synthase [Leifsonia sp.]|nr:ACP synthase [Leifsonia sp.]|tara:strand:+ start:83250 stop:84302 length:1053 start_codon:yes stop_codon:yes gene_type:complete